MDRSSHLRDGVREAYSAAAERPHEEHAFPVGRSFAESIGYPKEQLDRMPSVSVNAFAGVSNVSIFANLPAEATVLDLGCGAGLDSLIAAERVGPKGRVIGIDFSDAMLRRARQAAGEFGGSNVEFSKADAEKLPLEDGLVDVALVNGIFNLNPARDAIFRELARVMREGGEVFAAELVLQEPLSQEMRKSETNWFA
ncbi:MAG: methyltransferase domain-containing protein [Pseudomonadota bacterium]